MEGGRSRSLACRGMPVKQAGMQIVDATACRLCTVLRHTFLSAHSAPFALRTPKVSPTTATQSKLDHQAARHGMACVLRNVTLTPHLLCSPYAWYWVVGYIKRV